MYSLVKYLAIVLVCLSFLYSPLPVKAFAISEADPVHNPVSIPGLYQVVWQRDMPDLTLPPLASGSNLFLVTGTSVVALDTHNGRQVWRCEVANHLSGFGATPPVSVESFAPTATASLLLVAFSKWSAGHLLALDIHTGQVRWDFDTSAPVLAPSDMLGQILSQPVVWHDRVIIRTARGLTAVSLKDGTELWNVEMDPTFPVPLVPNALPALDAKNVYMNADFGIAYAFHVSDGVQVWRCPTEAFGDKMSASVRRVHITFTHCPPLLDGDQLLVADGLGNVYGIHVTDGTIIWQTMVGYTFQFAVSSGDWLVATSRGLYRINPNTGKVLDAYRVAGGVLKCAVVGKMVILIDNPVRNPGWEAFNLVNWTKMWHDTSFDARLGVSAENGMLFLAGFDTMKSEVAMPEVRAYRLSNSNQPSEPKQDAARKSLLPPQAGTRT